MGVRSTSFKTRLQQVGTDDRGGMSMFAVITAVAVVLAAGLVADGGTKLRAARQASAIAEEAARAGAGQVDEPSLYAYEAGESVWRVSPDRAVEAAQNYLAEAGYEGEVTIAGDQTVRVTVTVTRPTLILQMIGIGEVTVTQSAEADLVKGIEGPEQ